MRDYIISQFSQVPVWAWIFLAITLSVFFSLWWIASLDLRLRYRQMKQAAVVARGMQQEADRKNRKIGLAPLREGKISRRRALRERKRRTGAASLDLLSFLATVMVYLCAIASWTFVSYGHEGGALTFAGLATVWLMVKEK